MGNVRAVSFARATHHEATKSRSMTACVGTRECKEPSAPGEVPVKTLSDGGSTPPTSTKRKARRKAGFSMWWRKRGELDHVRTCRRHVHEPVRTLANSLIFSHGVGRKKEKTLPAKKCRQLPPPPTTKKPLLCTREREVYLLIKL